MFKNSQRLLYELGKVDTVLSGSRALEYFLEGSATETSAWDFYCHADLVSIYGTMEALEASGVVWHELHEVLRKLLDRIPQADVISILTDANLPIDINNLLVTNHSYLPNLEDAVIYNLIDTG